MNKPLQRELFAQRPVRSDFARHRGGGDGGGPKFNPRKLIFLASLVIIAILIGVGINMMNPGGDGKLEEIPTIQAELPIKERPDQPGGIDIPHQDVAVFEKLDGKVENAARPNVEHLLPAPEIPSATPHTSETAAVPSAQRTEAVTEQSVPPTAEAAQVPAYEEMPPAVTAAAESAAAPDSAEPSKPVSESVEPAVKKEAAKPAVVDKKRVVEPAKVQTAKPTAKTTVTKATSAESQKAETALAKLPKELFTNDNFVPTTAPATAPAKTVVTAAQSAAVAAPSSGKSVAIQLASMPDEKAAQKEAAIYQNKYAGILGGTTLRVVRADLGSKGTYYRIMSNPVTETKAKAMCSDITKLKKGSCLVVK